MFLFAVQSFPLLEMFWSTNQNKLLSNHWANLKSHEASLLIMKFRDDSRAYGNIKRNQTRSYEPFLLLAWINSLQEKRNGSSISVSMDLMPIKRRDLQSNYLLSMLNHFTQKYLMADLGGQESRFSELCEDTSLIFLLVGINGLQRDILSKDFGRGEAELDLWSRCQGSRVLCRGSIFY